MNYGVQNIPGHLSVRNKRDHPTFARAGQVFFGLLFLFAIGLKVEGQTATITVSTPSVCQGGTQPIITFTGSGGNPEYTFTYIIDNGTTQSTLTTGTSIGGIINDSVPTGTAGAYVYILQSVTDNTNNTAIITGQSVTVTVNSLPIPTITANGLTTFVCPGGSVTLTSSLAVSHQWNFVSSFNGNITPSGITSQSLVSSGGNCYSVTVTDINGCFATSDSTCVRQNPPPQNLNGGHNTTSVTACVSYDPDILNFNPPNALVSGGIAPYTYQWQNSLDGGASWNNISGETSDSYDPPILFTPGSHSYRAIIMDVCGETLPTTAKTITIVAGPTITINSQANVLCFGASTGAIDIATSGVAGPYSYAWTGTGVNATAEDQTGLAAGNYSVIATDTNGCSNASLSVTITQPAAALSVALTSQTNVLCFGTSTGAINITASGGVGPYSYTWTGTGVNATAEDQTGLAAGNYSVIVTDANGCAAASLPITITQPATAVSIVPTSQTNVLCFGASTGAINITASGGVGPYSYTWTGTGVNVAEDQTGLAAGNYSVIVTDVNGCATASLPISITQPATAVSVVLTSQTNVLCFGASTGTINITASGGINPYSYAWTGTGVNAMAEDQTGLSAGNYSVIITDGNGCSTASLPVTITQPSAINISSISSSTPVCAGNTLNLFASANGGSGSLSYSWHGPNIFTSNSQNPSIADITIAAYGTYTVTVTDGNSCSASATTTIMVNALPVVTLPGAGPLCVDAATVQLAGTPAGGTYSGTGVSATGLFNPATAGAGSHVITYTYTNANGCIASATTTIVVNALPVVTLPGAGPLCIDAAAVQLAGTPAGGTYSGTGVSATGLFNPATAGAGSHVITYAYTDANGCIASATTTIVVSALPVVTLPGAGPLCVDAAAVQLAGTPAGGTYSGTSVSSAGLFTPATAGSGSHVITYTFTNANGCIASATTTIVVNALPVVTLPGAGPLCVDAAAVQLAGTPAGGIYSGTSVSATGLFNPATAGAGSHVITYTYTDANGCIASATTTIVVNALPVVTLPGAGPLCVDAAAVQLAGTPAGGTYSGTSVSAAGLFTPATAGAGSHVITYTYTDANGCIASATTTIVVSALPVVTLPGAGPLCVDAAAVQLAGTPAGGTYSGTSVSAAGLFTPATAGSGSHVITYTFTNANGCIASATTTIVVNALPVVTLPGAGPLCVDAAAVQLAGTPAGGTYSGTGVSATGLFNPATAGSGSHVITYTYTNANGCIASATTTIVVNALPVVTLPGAGPLCVDAAAVQLAGTPAGGTYSGTSVNAAGLFNPATAGSGSHVITYTYTNANGCIASATTTIMVNALPVVTLPGAGPLCVDAAAVQLAGTPAGGTYSGTGVSTTGLFNPATAGAGSHVITYAYTDANGCIASATTTIVVSALPVVTLPGAGPLCVDAAAVQLAGTPAGGTYSGTGVSATGLFNPATAGSGSHVITYTYTNANGCIASATTTIVVNALPVVTLPGAGPLCVDAAAVQLAGTPAGGTYSGTGVSTTGLFNPATAGAGSHVITYTYTNANGCIASATTTIVVNALPVVTLPGAGPLCVDAAAVQLAGTPAGGTYSGTEVSATGLFNPATAGAGSHVITYTYTNANGCIASATTTIVVNALPVVTLPGAGPLCIDAAAVQLAGTPAGGTYSGTGVSTTGLFTPATAGSGSHVITYTYTNANGCIASATTTIVVNALPVVTLPGAGPLCVDAAAVQLAGTPAGGTYSGTGVSATGLFNPATAGAGSHVITYTYTDANGCIASATTTIVVNALPVVTLPGAGPLCVDAAAVQLAGTPAGGTYSGTGVSATGLFNPATAGAGSHVITYTYTNANGCIASATTTIVVNALPVVTLPGAGPLCVDAAAVQLAGTPAGGTYSGTGVSATGLFNPATAGAGSHVITYAYTDANGCIASATTTIMVNALPVVTLPGAGPLCVDAATVQLAGTPAGGTYSGTGVSATGLFNPATAGAGSHVITYTYTNANGCIASATTTIVVNALPVVTLPGAGPLCIDAAAVQLAGTPAGGTYSGTGVSATGLFNPATAGAGSHVITYAYTDANGCIASATTTIVVNALPVVTLPGAGPLCVDAAAVQLAGTPAGGTYSGTEVSATGLFNPATAGAGSHVITYAYTNANGCIASATTTIVVNALPVVTLPGAGPLCVDAAAVQLAGTPAGGTYSGTSISATGLFTPATAGAGSHVITYAYTNANGCIASATTTIVVNALPVVTLPGAGPLCVDAAAVQLAGTPAGGTYSGTGMSATGLFTPATAGAGSHVITYTYTDANGCIASATTTIVVNALPVVTLPGAGPLCIDAAAAQLAGTPADGTYSGTGVSAAGLFTPATAGAGSHVITYTYTDANGCIASATTTIMVNALPVVTLPGAGPLCVDAAAVQLAGTPAGGTYSGTGVSATGLFTPATAGAGSHVITYTYTDANGCIASATTTIVVNALPVVTLPGAGPLCVDAAAVQLAGTPAGGTYSGTEVSATGLFNPATAGAGSHVITYTYTNANGCIASATTTIVVNALPVVTLPGAGPLCIDAAAVQLAGTPAGGTYSGTGVSTTGLFTPATAGSGSHVITYTFTNANGCIASATTTIVVNALPVVTLPGAGPLCVDAAAVQLAGTPAGGTYSGTEVSATGLFNPATAGAGSHVITYTYTNANGCIASATTTIVVNALPVVTLPGAGPLCIDAAAVQLAGTPAGGTYSGTGVSTTGLFTPATAGSGSHVITYTFTNANGCIASATTTIVVNALPVVTLPGAGPLCVDAAAVQLAGTPAGGTYSGTGVSAAGLFTPATAGAGVITYTYTDANGCIASATTTIVVNALPVVTLPGAGPLCVDAAAVQLAGTPAGGTYSGTEVSATGLFNPATAGAGSHVITYAYTNANGCIASATTTIVVNALPVVTLPGAGPLCVDAAAVQLAGTPAGGTYSGTSVSATGLFTPATAGSGSHVITYTYTNANGCIASATTTIVVSALPVVTLPGAGPLCVDAAAVQLAGTPAGGTYSGTGVSTTGLFTPATAGAGSHVITYTYTDANGCIASATTTIVVNALPVVTLPGAGPLCVDAAAVQLAGTPAGGTYSGTEVSATGLFNPATAGAGSHVITYAYTNANGCIASATTTIVVNALPVVTLPGAGPLCVDAAAVQLAGTPAGGTYSGTGVSATGLFNPATAGAGSHVITYAYTNANGCIASATTTIVVNALPVVTLPGAGPLCVDAAAVQLAGTPAGGTYSGTGVSTTGLFTPATAGAGSHVITYTYTDANGCIASATTTIVVNALPVVTLPGAGPLCVDAAAVQLAGTPAGGTYSGTEVSATGLFNPATAGAGSHVITYAYTDANGCIASATTTIVVNALPVVTLPGAGPLCVDAAAVQLAGTPAGGTYSGTGVSATGLFNPATAGAGSHVITYAYTNANGCIASATTTIVAVNPNITPKFDAITPICSGAAAPTLPTKSTNNITGTWSPATVSNTTSATYTFTPDAGLCATTTTLSIVVKELTTTIFEPIDNICQNSAAPILPIISTNGISGTWSSTVTTITPGTTTYTFTPNENHCAAVTTLSITIDPLITPAFHAIPSICQNAPAPALPITSLNGITGTWSPAISTVNAGTTAYTFTPDESQCAGSTTLSFTVEPLVVPTFDAIDPICENDAPPILPNVSTNNITGTWSPASISNTASGTYTFTPDAGQCGATTTIAIEVNPTITPTFDAVSPICSGATAPVLPTTSINGITGTWSPAIVSNTTSATYRFTPNEGQCAIPVTLNVAVTNQIIPTFDPIPDVCQNATAPVLLTTSLNGITGTWNPATVSSTSSGIYTFIPDADQCASTTTITITVTDQIIPDFDKIGPLCQNSLAPGLPAVSINGITGTWNPATINTAHVGTTDYTFTSDEGQCGTTVTLSIAIADQVTLLFNDIGPLCQNSIAPILPTISSNNVSGTWSPATINTANSGTTVYSFTPDADECGLPTTLSVTIDPLVTPIFDLATTICANSAAPILPATSDNGITGTWSPATVSNTTTGSYTFTPDLGLCATATTITVTVNPNITPVFDAIAPICSGGEAPVLPAVSSNGVTGTWNPAIVSNTTSANYTFTPDAGHCAATQTLTITVQPKIVPAFNSIDPICSGDIAPTLPVISLNGITGTWNPTIVSNTNSGVYTFTPDEDQCATTITIIITVTELTEPTFDAIPDICQNTSAPTLPTTSLNGITGSWSPAVSTAAPGTTTYTFTPNAGQCATTTTLSITVDPLVTPTFTPVDNVCQNSTPPILPTTSINGITGSWSSAVSTSDPGTATYTFTPDAGQCATTSTLSITVDPLVTPTFTPVDNVCQNSPAPVLPTTSINGITGTWSPAVNTADPKTTTYTFTPDAGKCATTITLSITVDPILSSTTNIVTCANQLPFRWNNNDYSAEGTYNVTLISEAGCDSIATFHLQIIPVETGAVTITICEAALPYNWNNQSITAVGDYTATLTSLAGCDSTATLHLIVNNNVTGEETINICEAALPYTWNNQSITAAGDYTATLTSNNGCDSIATLHLVMSPVVTGEETITLCEAALPYNWNNQSITAAGDYTATLTNINGCDSIATLHLVINLVVTGEETITICEAALPYTWNNQSLTAAGDYTAALTSVDGCDSIATLHLVIKPVVTGEETITICEAALPYSWNNQSLTAAGDYTALLVSVNGCDSIATLHLVINPVVTGEETITICEAALPYTWNNQSLTAAGDYTATLTSINGCDSIATLHLVVNPVVTGEETITICEVALPYAWNNQLLTAAGDYTASLVSVNGCDSIATLHLVINPVVTDEETVTVCEAALPYTWNNQSLTAAGDYAATLTSVDGCDSIATLHLVISPVVTGEETITICEAALPYTWNNQSPTAAGDYTAALTSVDGCDSIATLHLVISPVVTGEETITICEAALPYNWNNQSLTAAGDYTATLTSVDGCDSIATLHLVISSVVTGEETITICEAALPFNWNNQSLTAAGDYTAALPSVDGCDSVATLHLVINPVVTGEETITICEAALPYNWNNQSLTAAGDYTATLTSVNGCDSIATLHLVINPVVTGEETITICEAALPYSWNNQSLTAAGDYTTTLASVNGCDSIATLHLVTNPVVTGEETVTICEAALPYSWNNQSITAAGDYTATLTSINGCDSIATLHLVINPVITGEETITICEAALPYTWNNQSLTAAGDYTAALTSINGCDSIATLHLVINPVVTGEETITICEGALPYTWNNQLLTATGDYTATLTSINGCDSIAILHLVINPVVTGEETITICEAALPYSWNNQSITAAGDYTAALTSINGCDSIATLHLVISSVVTGEEFITICEAALPYTWNNQSITAAGDYTATLTSVDGCDSIATLHLVISSVVTGEETITICEAALPFNWNNQSLTAAGDYTAALPSVDGCDSVATLHLVINPVVTGEESITICEAALPYTWNNQSITAAGDYTATLTSVDGCDSIATLHLVISSVVTGEETITICEAALPFNWNNQSLTAAGDYTAALPSVDGCDSVATLHLVINPVVTGEETITICEAALPYNWNNQSLTAAGDYTATLTSVNGCDSIATLHLVINPVITGEETITICEPALPYKWNNQSITAAGDYTATLTSINGCDSIATLHLVINSVVTGEETITICEAALPYTWNNQSLTAAGDYTATLTSINGCDSIAILHLVIKPVVTGEETITICEAALPYSWNNQSITAAGDYTAALTSINGCDSIATLQLVINPVVTREESITICEAALPYTWNNQSITAAGDYTATLTSVDGCDSIATLHLVISSVVTGEETITICEAALPFNWNNQSLTAAGDYTAALPSVDGCDSVATLHLVINPVVTGEETITICEAALPYTWNNQSITAAGDYTATLTSINSCDSIATLHLVINPVVTGEETITICEAALPYSWNNQSITAAGDYTATLTSVNGCDSIATLHLVINPVLIGEETITICEAALPYTWNNQSITAAGDYTATLTSVNGCDSIATLHLVINPVVTDEETITICEAALPYTWNNQSLTTDGDYTATLVSVNGCDSIATLHLVINPVVTDEETITICEAALPYTWNNQALTAAGDYTASLVSVNGCDSIAILHLVINPVVTGEETITICEAALPYTWNNQSLTAAGEYTATLTSVNGCNSIATLHLIISPQPEGPIVTTSPAICNSVNGVITVTLPAPGNGVSYSINGIDYQSSNIFTALAPGNFTVTVKNANGCTASANVILEKTTNTFTITETAKNASCLANNGAIDITVNGGNTLYTYRWSGPGNFSSSSEDLDALVPGEYTVVITDVNGCMQSKTIKVEQVNSTIALNNIVTNTVCIVNNGSIDLVVTGGTAPYTFAWTNGSGFIANTEDLSNLAAGIYNVIVTDVNGCTISTTATVIQTDQIPKIVTTDIHLCSPANLTDPTVTTGSDAGLALSYWLDATATNPITDPTSVLAGTYYIRGINQFGCSSIEPVTVTIESTPIFVVTNPAAMCEPATVDLTAANITAGSDQRLEYTYWTDAATTVPLANPQAVSESGTYYIKASAVAGCSFEKSLEATVTINKGERSIRYPTVITSPNAYVQLNAREPGLINNYTWTPPIGLNAYNRKDPVFHYDKNTEYTVRIDYGNECPVIDTVLVLMSQDIPGSCASGIYVPKAWSPNKDGHNDALYPIPVCIRELRYFRVFNRRGQLLFETNVLNHGWDGIFKGQPQVIDVYTWTLEAIGEDGKFYKREGNSVLLR